jgi:hypothetical protein
MNPPFDLKEVADARIYPAIGIARVGNSPDEFFVGPEIPIPTGAPDGGYRDKLGNLKRQAARFRIYAYNRKGKLLGELTSADADIEWIVRVANKKADWYDFDMALDLRPEAAAVQSARRNAGIPQDKRYQLNITPGPVTIQGNNQTSPPMNGMFFNQQVYLGELRTDHQGRLLFLGGRGAAGSPLSRFNLNTFANNPAWYDDTSDGPVDAKVTVNGVDIPVNPAWVVTAPPNYAPDVIPLVSMYDTIFDGIAGAVISGPPDKPSFTRDILPIFQRLTQYQWVNNGFFVQFGWLGPNDFTRPDYLARLSASGNEFQELRNQLCNMFRDPSATVFQGWQWPPIYGDALSSFPTGAESPRSALSLTSTMYGYLTSWRDGKFEDDYKADAPRPTCLDDYPPADRPGVLDRAALTFCSGGPFHPGCEMTWPMRQPCLYRGQFRLRCHGLDFEYPDYGDFLNQATVLGASGPLSASGPGDITRWMAVPWQADTASCLDGYPQFDSVSLFNTDNFLPSFWPARAPNEVLAFADYQIAIDPTKTPAERIAAFNRRVNWLRSLTGPYVDQLTQMVATWHEMGVIESRPGSPVSIPGVEPFLPAVMQVEVRSADPQTPPAGAPPRFPAHTRAVMLARYGGLRRR